MNIYYLLISLTKYSITQIIRHKLSPDAARRLDKVLDVIADLVPLDVAMLGHALLCVGLSYLPKDRQNGFVDGLETSVPNMLKEFADAGPTGPEAIWTH
jgi:hypothetical protein